jgi:putative DNA primase/helicase
VSADLYEKAVAAGFPDALVTAFDKKYPICEWEHFQGRHLSDEERAEQRALAAKTKNAGFWSPMGHGLVCFDPDDAAGLELLRKTVGRDVLERTARERTPRGWHYFFGVPEGDRTPNAAKIAQTGLDFRGYGGGVKHYPSAGYVVKQSIADGVEPLPEAARALLTPAPVADRAPAESGGLAALLDSPAANGSRNAWLTKVCGHYAADLRHEDAYLSSVRLANSSLPEPLGRQEWRKTALSIWKKEHRQQKKPGAARVVCMADVPPVAVTWYWPGRIPEGKIALLIGDPGMGKTMLALDILARGTRGANAPDGSSMPAGDVVILTAEDGLADTIRPRLDAAGADVSRVWVIESVKAEGDAAGKLFSLADDVGALEEVVSAKHARLVMIDPLDGYLRGVDSHRNSEVRGVLAPLAAMLERTGATGLCVHHLNKDASTVNALYRAGGSLAFVAAARAVFGVAPDPDCEGRSLFLPVKLNIAAKPPGLGYRVTDQGIAWDSDPVTIDAATAFGGPKKADSDLVSAAKDFLSEVLGEGVPIAQVLIDEEAVRRSVSRKSLQTAKKALGVKSKREGFGAGGLWYWQLPNTP